MIGDNHSALNSAIAYQPARPGVGQALHWSWAMLRTFVARRRQRRALRELDERFLRDVGLTRTVAARESAKPFWRA